MSRECKNCPHAPCSPHVFNGVFGAIGVCVCNAPYVDPDTNTWWEYDPRSRAFVDTGVIANGASAYEIAVKYGYEGTEEEFAELLLSIDNKVDKVEGMGLSANDYTNEDKAKVNAIPENPQYTDTTYTAGEGINISEENVISVTGGGGGGGTEYFDVTLTRSGGSITANHTMAEMFEAYDAGKILRVMETGGMYYPLMFVSTYHRTGMIFGSMSWSYTEQVFYYYEVYNNTWSNQTVYIQKQTYHATVTVKGGLTEDDGDWEYITQGAYAGLYWARVDMDTVGYGDSLIVQHSISTSIQSVLYGGELNLYAEVLPTVNDTVTCFVIPGISNAGVVFDVTSRGSSITIDSSPTQNSGNAVSSGGVYTALTAKAERFEAEYGVTTLAQLTAAYNAGKIITVAYTDAIAGETNILELDDVSESGNSMAFTFSGITSDRYVRTAKISLSSGWRIDTTVFATTIALAGKQDRSDLVTSLSSQSTDEQYPSAKCVYDAINAAITDAIEEAY